MLIAAAAAAVVVVSGASASRQLFGSGGPTCTMDSWCAWQPDASCPTPAPTQMLKEFPSCSWTEASIDGDLPLDNNNNVNNNLRVNNNDGSEAFCDQDGDKANWIEFDKDLHGGALTVRGFDSKELDALVTVKHAYKAATDLSGCGTVCGCSTLSCMSKRKAIASSSVSEAAFYLSTGGTATCPVAEDDNGRNTACTVAAKYGKDVFVSGMLLVHWSFMKLTVCLVPNTAATGCSNAMASCTVRKVILTCKVTNPFDTSIPATACSGRYLQDAQIYS